MYALYVIGIDEAWVVGLQGNVYHTTDGGQNWRRESIGYPAGLGLSALHGTPEGHLVVGGFLGFLAVRHRGERALVSTFSVPFGRIVSGTLNTLQGSDDSYLLMESRTPTQQNDPYAQIVVESTVTTPSSPPHLYFRFEGRTNASPTTSVKQIMELFNFQSNQWEFIEERLADNSSDSSWESAIRDSLSFIQIGTGRVRARISWYKIGDLFVEPWNIWVDHVQWSLLPSPIEGDVNGDGCVDDSDLLQVLFAFGQTGEGFPEDVNRDGVVDDGDLLIVLFHFGDGC